jgi:receptor protein-tyrosine kinase
MAAKPAVPPAQDNIIMVTSARPGEGKSFSSLNLAGSLAACSLRPVILVDADIKRHTLTTLLGLAGREGLLNLAADQASDDADMLVGTPIPLLRIMPIGLRVPKDATVSGRTLLNALGRCAHQHADSLIVLDTAPCLSSSEPNTLASLAGHVVMIVEAQQTQRAELEAALGLVSACPSVALMLNKVQFSGSDTFGAYGY